MINETTTKKYPVYSGTIEDGLRNEIGKIAVWTNEKVTTDMSPALTGNIEVDGVRYKVSLWSKEQMAKIRG